MPGFASHMLAHMALVAVVAPLVALAVRGRRFDPVVHYPRLFVAIPASLVELIAVWAWHAPSLHEAARHQLTMWAAEQASFLAAGLYFWFAVLGGTPQRRQANAGNAIIALVLTFSHMTLLGAIFVLAPRPLYLHGHAADTLVGQQLGGAIMLVLGGAVYIAAGLALGRSLLRTPIRRESRA